MQQAGSTRGEPTLDYDNSLPSRQSPRASLGDSWRRSDLKRLTTGPTMEESHCSIFFVLSSGTRFAKGIACRQCNVS